MRTPKRTFPWTAAWLLIAPVILLSCNRSKVITELPPQKESCTSCTILKWDTLKKLLAEKGKIVLEIYPVKYSPDMSQCKVDLVTYLSEAEGKRIARKGELPDKAFEEASKNYVAYLKKKDVPRDRITLGYQMVMTRATSSAENNVKICYNSDNRRLDYPGTMIYYDSCRVPPGCAGPTVQSSAMRKVIDQVYMNNKN
jgi:hypothetical protein